MTRKPSIFNAERIVFTVNGDGKTGLMGKPLKKNKTKQNKTEPLSYTTQKILTQNELNSSM